jgi:hypothetical protein
MDATMATPSTDKPKRQHSQPKLRQRGAPVYVAATIWGVTRRVLHRWIRAGEVRAWKTDKYTIVDLESLEAKVTRNPK